MPSRIEGKVRMRKVLKALPDAVRKQLRAAVLAAAEDIANTQRNLAPVRTGALRRSIKVTPGDQALPEYASLKSKRRESDPELSAVITAGSQETRDSKGRDYTRWVEFGTTDTSAQPFFYPGFRAGKKRAQARINRAARQGIKDGLR